MAEEQETASTDQVLDEECAGFKDSEAISTFGFDLKSEKSDLALIVENRPLYVKRSVLEDASPVFESMLASILKGDTIDQLVIEGEKYAVFAEFLACIHPRRQHKITRDNAFTMLELADKYRVDDLKQRCEDNLRIMLLGEETSQTDFVLKLLRYACMFGLDELKTSCLAVARKRPSDSVLGDECFTDLPAEAKCTLYEEFYPGLSTKSYLADIMMMTKCSKEEISKMQQFNNANKVKITYLSKANKRVYTFNIWDIDWKLSVDFTVGKYSTIKLECDKTVPDLRFTSHIGLWFIMVNHIPWKENRYDRRLVTFDTADHFWNTVTVLPIDQSDTELESHGFKCKGQITIEVHLLVNKPVYK